MDVPCPCRDRLNKPLLFQLCFSVYFSLSTKKDNIVIIFFFFPFFTSSQLSMLLRSDWITSRSSIFLMQKRSMICYSNASSENINCNLVWFFFFKSWKWRHTAKVQRRRAVAMCGSQSCYTAVIVCPVCTQRRRFGWNPLFLCSCELAEQETNEEWTESEQSDSSRLLTLLKHSSDTATESEQMGFLKSREWFYLSFK